MEMVPTPHKPGVVPSLIHLNNLVPNVPLGMPPLKLCFILVSRLNQHYGPFPEQTASDFLRKQSFRQGIPKEDFGNEGNERGKRWAPPSRWGPSKFWLQT